MSKYIKLFNTHAEYETFIGGGGDSPFVKPNVSHCIQENEVHYNPYDYSDRYLTFIAREDGATFTFNGTTVNEVTNKASYSLDGGKTWTEIASGVSTSPIDSGERILWKGEMTPNPSNYQGIGRFTSTKTFDIEGNVMSLLFGGNFEGKTSLEGKSHAFQQLFRGTNVVSAENLLLPATALTEWCYSSMFGGCTSLTTAPELPATTLASYCYNSMFNGCTSLTTAPELPATTLAEECYMYMFYGCTNLITAPSILPATNLASRCCYRMFQACTSLTTAPELPAKTLANECYYQMFDGCTNLITAPSILPATNLADSCYREMFQGCTSLTTAPSELSATAMAENCCNSMFYGCTSMTTAPELPATTLAQNCYSYMFHGCTSLTTAPSVLPATTLAEHCYDSMFNDCTSLTRAPELPATNLTEYCYSFMFMGCTNLNYIKAMFTTTPSDTYTNYWVDGVSATGTFVKNSSATWNVIGTEGIPNGWTVETASA